MKVCNFSLGKFFIFLCFSFISIFNLSASCVKVEKPYFIFLPEDGDECVDKSKNGALPLYSNFEVLIPGKTRNGYTIELVFDRDNQAELSGEQSLFAFYSREDNVNPVYELVLRGSSVFYKINNEEQDGVDLSVAEINDPDIIEPHSIVITHDNFNNILYLNIDSGADLEIKNVPKVNVAYIGKVELGKNYVGEIGEMRIWGVKFNINQRSAAARLLAGMTGAKISTIETVKDENGITTSAVPKVNLIKCQNNMIVINGECNNAIISGFIPPSNSSYNGGSDIEYDSAHIGRENAVILSCNPGYEIDGTDPKYWFNLNGDLASVEIEGGCKEKIYYLTTIPANMRDPGAIAGSKLSTANYQNPMKVSCYARYDTADPEGKLGLYIDENDILQLRGDCNQYIGADPQCYTAPIGSIGNANGCNQMLIVDIGMLRAAKNDNSFDFKPSDSYTSHSNNITYKFEKTDGSNNTGNIFTGRVTDLSGLFSYKTFNGDISHWDVTAVTSMYQFLHKSTFNNNSVSNWDVRNVTNMIMAFAGTNFNHDLSNWDVSYVTQMDGMFLESGFNNNSISNWNVSRNSNFSNMFSQSSFNQDLSNWDVSNATIFQGMFAGSSTFNNNSISNWNVKNVTNMHKMFYNNKFFNQDLSNWNTNSVTNMAEMFYGTVFNQNISNWCVQNVTNYNAFSNNGSLSSSYTPSFGTSDNCN
jgi:surface protein